MREYYGRKKIIFQIKYYNKCYFNIYACSLVYYWISFFGVSTYSIINDNRKSQNYLETEGKLVSYELQDSMIDDEYYEGVYEYKVNGVTYKGSPSSVKSNPEEFKQTLTVKYDPNNPEEYVMEAGWNKLLIVGTIMIIVVVAIFISVKVYVKKLLKRAYGIEKDN